MACFSAFLFSAHSAAEDLPLTRLLEARQRLAEAGAAAKSLDSGAGKQDRLERWKQRHPELIEALSRAANSLSASATAPAEETTSEIELPADASPALEDLLLKRAQARNRAVQALNSLRLSSSAQRHAALSRLLEENTAERDDLLRSARTFSAALPAAPDRLPEANIPAALSAAAQATLFQRDSLLREAHDLENRLLRLNPEDWEVSRRQFLADTLQRRQQLESEIEALSRK